MNVNSNEHDIHKGKKGSVLNLPSPILLNKRSVFQNDSSSAGSNRRNYMLLTDRKDGLIDWMKEMLFHSFVLNEKETYCGTMMYFEELIEEHRYFNATDEANYSSRRLNNDTSRLKQYVPTVGRFFTSLPLHKAFKIYDEKYFISERNFVAPSFNEIRHILNLAQIMAIGRNLQLISFDGDQTLYSDGGNFEDNDELASAIILLLKHNVKVALITAAGYGLDGSRYAQRLRGLLDRFIIESLDASEVACFYVFGGECNYLLQCNLQVRTTVDNEASKEVVLIPIPVEVWQAEHLRAPKPFYWPADQVTQLLDIAEGSMRETMQLLHLRVKVLRKERAVGIFPGGEEMCAVVPRGHGSNKLKREALEEVVMRVMEKIRQHRPAITLPYCVFNGGGDAWLDVGNKSVGVACLQAYFDFPSQNCLHVGDQFLKTGNDLAARDTCPCIWITNPRETGKVLQYVLNFMEIRSVPSIES